MSGTLRFELASPGEDEPVDFETFAVLTEHLSGLLDELDKGRSGTRSVRWLVTDLRLGSAVVEVTGEPVSSRVADVAPAIISEAVAGLATLRTGIQPQQFQGPAWTHARNLARLLRAQNAHVAIASNGTKLELGPEIELVEDYEVRQTITPPEVAVSTVEGSLDTVYVHDQPHFVLWDVIYRREVSCYFDRSDLPKVREGLGERVRVRGRVAFDVSGRPDRVEEMLDLRVLRDQPRPEPRDIIGLAPNLTGGLPAEEWVRRIRDAEG